MSKLLIIFAVAAFALASTPAKAQDAKKTAEAVQKAHSEAEKKGKPASESTAEAGAKAPKAAGRKAKSAPERTAEEVAKAHQKDVK